PIGEVRRLVDDPVGFDRALHGELATLGWTGLLIPERFGGAGMDYLAMALVLEEAGRCLLPGPLASTVLAALAIDAAGSDEQKQRWLRGIAAGTCVATVALGGPAAPGGVVAGRVHGGSWGPRDVSARARPGSGDGYVLDGIKSHVMWAGQ